MLPPGVRSATTLIPGQARAARRCSPGVLALQSFLHHGSGFGHSRRSAQGARPHATRTSGRPATTVAGRDLDSDAWTREPRIRRHSDSIEVRVPPSGGDPAHAASLERFVRQPPAPPPNPAGPVLGEASCPCPLFGGTPRLPALGDHLPRKGATTAGPRRRSFVEPSTRPHPLRGRLATEPLAELGLVVRSPPCEGYRIDPGVTGFRHSRQLWTHPLARGGPVVGPPVTRWANSRGISSLVDPARRCELRTGGGLWAFRVTPTDLSPRAKHPVAGTLTTPNPPTACVVEDADSRSPEPDELSPAGVSFESRRFADRAREPLRKIGRAHV